MPSNSLPDRIEWVVDGAAARYGDRAALVFGPRRWTFAQVQAEMERRAARLLRAGAAAGDLIATAEPVSDETVLTFLACCRANLTFLPLSPSLAKPEVARLIARAGARFVLTASGAPHPACPERPALSFALPGLAYGGLHALPDSADPAAVALLFATSGTTGRTPRLVRMAHRTLIWHCARASWFADTGAVVYRPGGAYLSVRDVCELLHVGATHVLSHALRPGHIEAELNAHRATTLATVPPVLRILVDQRDPPPTGLALRLIYSSSASLPRAVQEAAMRRYGVPTFEAYGSTEGGSLLRTADERVPPGSIGTPYAGVEARVVDEFGTELPPDGIGELIVRSPGMMLGYHDDPEATARAMHGGWLWTGDRARRDREGNYYLLGRGALSINSGGLKVAPEEVEAVLEQHPAVRETVVVGMPDPARGEVLRAIIVPRGERPAIPDLRRFCRDRLAGYKVPRQWEFREDLPRSPLGKVLRHKL